MMKKSKGFDSYMIFFNKLYRVCWVFFGLFVASSAYGEISASQQYGKVLAIDRLNLQQFDGGDSQLKSYSDPYSLGQLASFLGFFPSVLTTDETMKKLANINNKNTKEIYNFDPQDNLIANRKKADFPVRSISAYAIQYTTPGINAATQVKQRIRNVSGLVIVPEMAKHHAIKGIVLSFHQTAFGKNDVPSCLGSPLKDMPAIAENLPAYCNLTELGNTGAINFINLAGIFASNGYVVAAPDYLGQGLDNEAVHGYKVYPTENALSGLNMLPAVRQILSSQYNVPTSEKLGLYITGFSEGGAYTLKSSQLLQSASLSLLKTNNLDLKIATPYEGSYSLITQERFALEGHKDGLFNCDPQFNNFSCGKSNMVAKDDGGQDTLVSAVKAMNKWRVVSAAASSYHKPELNAYIMSPLIYYGYNADPAIVGQTLNPHFWRFSIDQKPVDLITAFNTPKFTGDQISSAINRQVTERLGYNVPVQPSISTYSKEGVSTYAFPLGHYGINSEGTLFMSSLLTSGVFKNNFEDANTYNWQTKSPINFLTLKYDSIVTPVDTYQAYACMHLGQEGYFDRLVKIVSDKKASVIEDIADFKAEKENECTAPKSGDLVQLTQIPNFQLTNNESQMNPLKYPDSSIAKFWTNSGQNSQYAYTGMAPFDHLDMYFIGNMIALCTFESMRVNNVNRAYCPHAL